MGGSLALFAVNLIAGAVYEAARAQPDKATQYAPAAVTMLFLFNISYAATWGTIAFLIPTEIWSSEVRAQGNGFGITGWAIGVGMTTLVNPIMFDVLENRTYFLFAGLNLLWIPVVFLCKFPDTAGPNDHLQPSTDHGAVYPETAHRSLESINSLFNSNSLFNWNMERNYQAHGDILAEHGVEEYPKDGPGSDHSSYQGPRHQA